jgi:hypothetical protein
MILCSQLETFTDSRFDGEMRFLLGISISDSGIWDESGSYVETGYGAR